VNISAPERYDVIGIGFGPSGRSPAVALDEQTTGAGRSAAEIARFLYCRLAGSLRLPGGWYPRGGTEHTPGLSSSLLSNVAVRSGEITKSIRNRTARPGAALAAVAEGMA